MLLITNLTKLTKLIKQTNQTGSREPDLRSRVREQGARSSWALTNWLLLGARAAMEESGNRPESREAGRQGAREPLTP